MLSLRLDLVAILISVIFLLKSNNFPSETDLASCINRHTSTGQGGAEGRGKQRALQR